MQRLFGAVLIRVKTVMSVAAQAQKNIYNSTIYVTIKELQQFWLYIPRNGKCYGIAKKLIHIHCIYSELIEGDSPSINL